MARMYRRTLTLRTGETLVDEDREEQTITEDRETLKDPDGMFLMKVGHLRIDLVRAKEVVRIAYDLQL